MRALLAAALLLVAAGCAVGGVDRNDYVSANARLLHSLPTYPGAHGRGERSTPGRDEEDGPVTRYVTTSTFELPVAATPAAVAHFFEEALCPRWALVERLDGPVLNFRRGNAAVSVNLDNWRVHMLELTVDHAARHDERSSLCPAKRRATTT